MLVLDVAFAAADIDADVVIDGVEYELRLVFDAELSFECRFNGLFDIEV